MIQRIIDYLKSVFGKYLHHNIVKGNDINRLQKTDFVITENNVISPLKNNNFMVFNFLKGIRNKWDAAVTIEEKRAICEFFKYEIDKQFKGDWFEPYLLDVVNSYEKTLA